MEITVSLIRSGLTRYDLENRYTGLSDEPLCEEGVLRLRQKKEAGLYSEADYVYTGNCRRCLETASIVYPRRPAVVVQGFVPFHFGDSAGKTYAEMEESPEFKRWALDQGEPGEAGEVYAAIYRNVAAFRDIMSECAGREAASAAVVAHRFTLLAIIRNYCIPRPTYRDIALEPGGCVTVLYNNFRDSARVISCR
jgi:alpha-ribazole phosphatase